MAKKRAIPLVDLLQFTKGDEKTKKAFIKKLGNAFHDIGFVGVVKSELETPSCTGTLFWSLSALAINIKNPRQYVEAFPLNYYTPIQSLHLSVVVVLELLS